MPYRFLPTLTVMIVLTFILTVSVLLQAGYGGIGQRILFLLMYAWVIGIAVALTKIETH